ncbi:MAG: ferrous iron transport protein A [Nitrososphaerota archaeon]|nr:ferrous iron transport protein A [Nitrososphaerota archaeon]
MKVKYNGVIDGLVMLRKARSPHDIEMSPKEPLMDYLAGDGRVKRLCELVPGERGVIVWVDGSGPLRRRLLDLGVVGRTGVVAVRRAPLGDPMVFRLRGYSLSLRRDEAENIVVKVE